MPRACRRTSRSLPAGTPAWPRSFGRLRRAKSRLCSSRGFIGPATLKIAWDSIWGGSATAPDALEGREAEFSFRATCIRKDSTMDLLTYAKNMADRVEAQSARMKVPVTVCVIDIHGNMILKHRM